MTLTLHECHHTGALGAVLLHAWLTPVNVKKNVCNHVPGLPDTLFYNCLRPNRQYVHSWAAETWRLAGIVLLLWDLTGIAVQFKPFQPQL